MDSITSFLVIKKDLVFLVWLVQQNFSLAKPYNMTI
jgi:hypothetical protein